LTPHWTVCSNPACALAGPAVEPQPAAAGEKSTDWRMAFSVGLLRTVAHPLRLPLPPRCPLAFDRCKTDDPAELIGVGGGHAAACWLVGG
jgi:hypothetical protein